MQWICSYNSFDFNRLVPAYCADLIRDKADTNSTVHVHVPTCTCTRRDHGTDDTKSKSAVVRYSLIIIHVYLSELTCTLFCTLAKNTNQIQVVAPTIRSDVGTGHVHVGKNIVFNTCQFLQLEYQFRTHWSAAHVCVTASCTQ